MNNNMDWDMDYQVIKHQSVAFVKKHPSYFWSVLEVAMVCAAGYSLFGLINMVTGAMATGSSVVMILEFMAAPLYAVMLFAVASAALMLLLLLPYALVTQLRLLEAAASSTPTTKKRTTKARSNKAKAARAKSTA